MHYKKIKTVPDAYEACGIDRNFKADVSSFPEEFRSYMTNHFDMIILCKAINKKEDGTFWEPNWNDSNERKWEIWPYVKADAARPSGFALADTYYDFWYASSLAGSRLCFQSREQAVWAFEQFPEQYKENLLIIKHT